MADGTRIEWTDATWNPITGCSVVSAGCKHCYAMKLAGTRLGQHRSRAGLTVNTKAGPVWTGEVRFNEPWIDQPLRWRRPRRIFVCAHGDLFHENVPDEWIDRVFAVMALATQHTFQVLTKRPERMLRYFAELPVRAQAFTARPCRGVPYEDGRICELLRAAHPGAGPIDRHWPLANVWLGVSVEDQKAADERIPLLLRCPAAVRWISAEPLLGPINLRWTPYAHQSTGEAYRQYLDRTGSVNEYEALRKLDWVVVGGESGPGARPMHPDWARSLRDQCAAAGVPLVFKQWGEWAPNETHPHRMFVYHNGMTHLPDDRIADPANFGETEMAPVGKKAAGRLLDGVLHDAYPEVCHA